MAEITPQVALLSTGNELVNGDVLNTNSRYFAKRLYDADIQPGQHLTVTDDQSHIEQGIHFLLANHPSLIISGGLGPTCDDRTRFALSRVIQQELIFDEASWQRLQLRLKKFSLPIPEINRQQCLFPQNAEIIPNDNGTASACRVTYGQQVIFMLPGPPLECEPIFENHVLPYLHAHGYSRTLFHQSWLLLGASEGGIATQLEPLIEHSNCQMSYRVDSPYLEIKLHSHDVVVLEKLSVLFTECLRPYFISRQRQKASTQLRQFIQEQKIPFRIIDQLTGGLLQFTLLTPQTYPYLLFVDQIQGTQGVQIILTGLESFWDNESRNSSLKISIFTNHHNECITQPIPYREERTPLWAMEIACWEIMKFLSIKK